MRPTRGRRGGRHRWRGRCRGPGRRRGRPRPRPHGALEGHPARVHVDVPTVGGGLPATPRLVRACAGRWPPRPAGPHRRAGSGARTGRPARRRTPPPRRAVRLVCRAIRRARHAARSPVWTRVQVAGAGAAARVPHRGRPCRSRPAARPRPRTRPRRTPPPAVRPVRRPRAGCAVADRVVDRVHRVQVRPRAAWSQQADLGGVSGGTAARANCRAPRWRCRGWWFPRSWSHSSRTRVRFKGGIRRHFPREHRRSAGEPGRPPPPPPGPPREQTATTRRARPAPRLSTAEHPQPRRRGLDALAGAHPERTPPGNPSRTPCTTRPASTMSPVETTHSGRHHPRRREDTCCDGSVAGMLAALSTRSAC